MMNERNFTRRGFLRTAGIGLAALSVPNMPALAGRRKRDKPNILFIFADDQCFETLRSLGCDEIHTPNLDRLVKNGVTFTHAYNQGAWHGAVCVSSRTMLNTGLFLWKARDIEPKLEREVKAGRFWSQYMMRAGYETYMSGKWHVKGIEPDDIFDHVRDVRPGMPNQTPEGYNRPIEGQPDLWSPWDKKFGGFWKGGKHWSEVLGDHAEDFLDNAGKSYKPFFMYLAFNAPHDPRQSPKEYVDKYPLDKVKVPENFLPEYPYKDSIGCSAKLRDEKLAPFPRTKYAVKVNRQEYYAITTHMDNEVGRILDALDASGMADNTYIFFSADHGLAVGHHGLMGKQNLFDHSLRVPLMVCGPDVPKDKKLKAPVYLQDIMASSLDLAGVDKPSHVQFKSLMPVVAGKRAGSYDAIYGGYLAVQRAVIMDDHKLLLYPAYKKVLLFNLADDPDEMKDLARDAKNKPLIKKLFARLLRLQKETGDTLDLKSVLEPLSPI